MAPSVVPARKFDLVDGALKAVAKFHGVCVRPSGWARTQPLGHDVIVLGHRSKKIGLQLLSRPE
jgi:hypothetical protein